MDEKYKTYYDNVAPVFDKIRLDQEQEIQLTSEIISQFIKPDEGELLDIGCGTGRYCLYLQEKGYSISGIDVSESQLKHAPQAINTQVASATQIPYKTECFKGCLMLLMLHQLSDKEQALALKEVYRVLKYTTIFRRFCRIVSF